MRRDKFQSATILLVDDKDSNLLALQTLLEKPGRIFFHANCGGDALKHALNKDIDLIILDVQMPDMDGFEVAQFLRSNRKTKDIPIIFASAEKKEYQSIIKGFEEGAVDYLFKPLDPEITKAKVSVLLKIQLQKKELLEKNTLLKKSELLINNSADIIGIVDPSSLKFEEVNNAFTSILGYSKEEVMGTMLAFFLAKEDVALLKSLTDSAKENLSFETKIYCKDRSAKWLHWNVVVKDEKWFINARDITEAKEVERIRMYLATVVKQSADAIYIHNDEGRIISWNEGAEKIYGYSEREAMNMKVWNIVPEFLHPETQSIVEKIFAGEKVELMETKRVTRQGKFVDVVFSAARITDLRTQQKSIAITERDVTQQKLSDEQIRKLNAELNNNLLQLRETNKELESFSYSVSHDLRSPLRAINGYARIIEEDNVDKLDEQSKDVLSKLTNNVAKMERLISDLLEFSKLGKKEVRKVNVDMERLVQDVIADINATSQHRASIHVASLPSAHCDRALFNQVWINLISNAIKYSRKKENPKIEIYASANGAENTYYIKDNGAGFDMTYADRLFGTFQRLHDSTTFEGTGVGLAIVKRIITKHGGNISADAKPEEGATFYFTLPTQEHGTSNNEFRMSNTKESADGA
jgi:PAS domain S-box-containing protein